MFSFLRRIKDRETAELRRLVLAAIIMVLALALLGAYAGSG
jgi:hypothetical protein